MDSVPPSVIFSSGYKSECELEKSLHANASVNPTDASNRGSTRNVPVLAGDGMGIGTFSSIDDDTNNNENEKQSVLEKFLGK